MNLRSDICPLVCMPFLYMAMSKRALFTYPRRVLFTRQCILKSVTKKQALLNKKSNIYSAITYSV